MAAWVLESALRSLMMAAVVWTGIRLLRVRNVAVQKAAWVLVLIAAIAMPGLAGWHWPQSRASVVVPARILAPVSSPDSGAHAEDGVAIVTAPLVVSTPAPVRRWNLSEAKKFVAPIYLAICAVLLLRLLFGWAAALRILYRAEKASMLVEPRASVRISEDIATPVTIGSTIVLPASFEDWGQEKLHVVLAHERSHIRQGDFFLQLLANLHVAFFWFSPLSWWLRREISDLAEAISDRAALAEAESRVGYAEVLVEFAGGRHRPLAGVAMARRGNLRRRIDRLLVDQKFRGAFTGCWWHVVVAAALVPSALIVAVMLVRVDAAEAMKPAAVPALNTVSAQAVLPLRSLAGFAQAAFSEPAQSQSSGSSTAASRSSSSTSSDSSSYIHISDDDENSYAIVNGDSSHVTGSGDFGSEFNRVRGKVHGSYIWFERDGKSYVIEDPALVSQAREMFQPIEELGRRQGELGEEQGRLGEQQGRLGEMQAKATAPAPDLSKEIAALQSTLQKLQQDKAEMSQDELAELQSKLADLQGRLGDVQGKIGEKQGELGEQEARLGEQQARLGERQAELGRQQEELSRQADQKMKALIDRAMQQGRARIVE